MTTNADFYEEHAENIELWSPGNPEFVAPEKHRRGRDTRDERETSGHPRTLDENPPRHPEGGGRGPASERTPGTRPQVPRMAPETLDPPYPVGRYCSDAFPRNLTQEPYLRFAGVRLGARVSLSKSPRRHPAVATVGSDATPRRP